MAIFSGLEIRAYGSFCHSVSKLFATQRDSSPDAMLEGAEVPVSMLDPSTRNTTRTASFIVRFAPCGFLLDNSLARCM